jgi:site-specific recombinase XerD
VLTESGKFGVERAGTITIATRGLVRFLVAKGRLTEGMEGAIPYPAKWGLASLPRFIEADEVEKAVAACDPSTPAGQRDRAIVLLFARLGLRAGEVAALCFDDIDWSGGVLGVSGKGRRHCLMPLPQDVGDATLAYIRDTRPRVANTHLFLGHSAPHRELSVEGVAKVGARALRRAGVQSPSYGSHVFRHSVATTMLRGGASLAAVGAVLRHSRPETTAHYAKVDLGMLSEIAQPWPEVSPC